MARSVIRLEEAECELFHANYCYMWKKLNTAPYYVCGYGEAPDWVNESWLLPSYANLSKCLNPDFVPSMNLVNKIVQFYNANISPAIDTYAFLHERLEDSDSKRGIGEDNKAEKMIGTYYGYYYAGLEEEARIYGAVLKLYNDGHSVSACMIAGLTDDDTLLDPKLRQILEARKINVDAYREYKKNLPLAKRRTSIYMGPATYSSGVLTLAIKDADRDGTFLHVRIPVGVEVGEKYIGSLGVITMVNEDYDIQFLKVGIERADDEELDAVSLTDAKLLDLLKIKKATNEHVYLEMADNSRWTDYLLMHAAK